MLDKLVNAINIIVAIGNIVDLFLFPLAIYQWNWERGDPRLVLLGYLSMFFIGWMTSTYIMFLFKEKRGQKNEENY